MRIFERIEPHLLGTCRYGRVHRNFVKSIEQREGWSAASHDSLHHPLPAALERGLPVKIIFAHSTDQIANRRVINFVLCGSQERYVAAE